MAKKVKGSSIAEEIKKEYLKEHLDHIKNLVESWIAQLEAPEPLTPQRYSNGWDSMYLPPVEVDPDSKHMLKHHLKSRALWRYHADWERKLNSVWQLTTKIRKIASEKHQELSVGKHWRYNDQYTIVALWQAFKLVLDGEVANAYKEFKGENGLAFGAFKIEHSAITSEERSVVEKEHREFIHYLSQIKEMAELIELWKEVGRLKEQMRLISNKALKSGDILYICMFCRHLWK